MGLFHTIENYLLNLIFPLRCLACGKEGVDFCLACLSECPAAERESASWIFPLYDYRHPPIKKALWLLKYKGKKRLAAVFAEMVHGKMMEELSDFSVMENFTDVILIPIPLSMKRRRERGYNQAELICRELQKINVTRDGLDWKLERDVLLKIKETEHQARIRDRSQRLKNLIGSFAVKNEQSINKKNIILIDDITTTGATLSEAKKVLRAAGARKVIAFTVAH